MKKFLITLGLVFLVGAAAAALAMSDTDDGMGEPHCWRYKVIVEINTPEGVKSGETVREACLTPFKGYNPQVADFKESVVGEAVVVDLGERGTVFAIMDQDGSIFDIENAFDGPKLFSRKGIEYYSRLPVGTKGVLNPERHPCYPKFVTFDNIKDPKTSEILAEWSIKYPPFPARCVQTVDHWTDRFGQEVNIKQIRLEITEEPITQKVKQILPHFGNTPRPIGFYYFKRG